MIEKSIYKKTKDLLRFRKEWFQENSFDNESILGETVLKNIKRNNVQQLVSHEATISYLNNLQTQIRCCEDKPESSLNREKNETPYILDPPSSGESSPCDSIDEGTQV